MRERSLRLFLLGLIVLSIPPLIGIARLDHLALHTAINVHHVPWTDRFFAVITHLGDGLVPTFLSIALLWVSWRAFLMVGLSAGLSAIAVQLLKHTAFAGVDRPGSFLAQMPQVLLVQGVELNHHFSFPSGHATAAFSTCLAVAVLLGRPRLGLPLALLAGLLGFSRIYLSQHFTEDVLAGAWLGSLAGCLVYAWLYRGPLAGRPGLDRSPFRRRPERAQK